MNKLFIAFFSALAAISLFSFGFVDAHFPMQLLPWVGQLIVVNRMFETIIYVFLVIILFLFYSLMLWRKINNAKSPIFLIPLINISAIILLISFPGFSYDIFNYIATAKVLFLYKENPYIVMPIEITHEPMLAYMHAANKVALYGPMWIILSFIPHVAGFGNILATIISFKLFVGMCYGLLVLLIWKLSNNIRNVIFFALNPLVLIETFVSGHNDVVMMMFAILSMYLLSRKKLFFATAALLCSVLIKYATIILVPVYCYTLYIHFSKRRIDWQKIWKMSTFLMFVMVLLGPVREELYPWYLIWPLSFIALIQPISWIHAITISFAFGEELRFAPFVYFRDWGGITPRIKQLVSGVFPIATIIYWIIARLRYEKK